MKKIITSLFALLILSFCTTVQAQTTDANTQSNATTKPKKERKKKSTDVASNATTTEFVKKP